MLYDVVIIGGGPAGVAAAVYTARKKLKTLLVTESFGGQSIVSDDIQNWIGEKHISGFDLAQKLEAHVRFYSDMVDIKMPERAVAVRETLSVKASTSDVADSAREVNSTDVELIGFGATPDVAAAVGSSGVGVSVIHPIPDMEEGARSVPCDFEIETDKGNKYYGKTVILTAGARRKKLGILGEDKFSGKGVAYCSTCDAPLFSGKRVAVVGGGNAGLEAVVDLFPYATKIYILEFADALKADPVTQEEVKKNLKTEIILNAETLEVVGDKFVTGLKYKDRKTNEEKTLEVGGVFVEIGSVPNSEMVKGLVDIDKYGQIIIDSKHASTSKPGIFAAGDITDDPYKQNNISAGDAVKAALAAYAYLLKRK